MRITVTGASGVIGRGVVLRLLGAGHEVVGLARRKPESWPSTAGFVDGDVRDAAAVRQALEGAEVVVRDCHQMAATGRPRSFKIFNPRIRPTMAKGRLFTVTTMALKMSLP